MDELYGFSHPAHHEPSVHDAFHSVEGLSSTWEGCVCGEGGVRGGRERKREEGG
jgi:hypothetical protein